MANLILAKMLFPVADAFSVNPTGGANMLTPDPKEVMATPSSTSLHMDMGMAVAVDTFFAGFLSSGVTSVSLYTDTGLGTGAVYIQDLGIAPTTEGRRHAFSKLNAPLTSRYFSYSFTTSGAATVGIAAMGAAVQPAFGHEWGSGRQPIDNASVQPLRGGGFSIERGAVKGSWQFTLGDLTDAELDALYRMTMDIGLSSPVLAVEDPAAAQPALNQGLHYGLLDRPEVYERQYPGISRWSFRVEEWV